MRIALVALTVLSAASTASAAKYTLWIHGYSPLCPTITRGDASYTCLSVTAHAPPSGQDPRDFFYYVNPARSGALTATGPNPRAVNWDGQGHLATTNQYITNALDCYCTGGNSSYIATHSTGDLQLGYALANYGGTSRTVRLPASSTADFRTDGASSTSLNKTSQQLGECKVDLSSGSARTQTGWNIIWVDAAGGAAGGSELANIGNWLDRRTEVLQQFTGTSFNHYLLDDLKPANARPRYDHNQTRGVWFYMFAGAENFPAADIILWGQDDGVVAYHSAGAVSGDADYWCNSFLSDGLGWWLGTPLPGLDACHGTLGTGTDSASFWYSFSTRAKWSNHTVQYRDDAQQKLHMDLVGTAFDQQNWGELISMERSDIAMYATP
jgi:hypothetical protein